MPGADPAEQRPKPAHVVRLHRAAGHADELPPLLTPGSYEAVIVGFDIYTVKKWKATKITVTFEIVRDGFPRVRVSAHYNYDGDKRKPFRSHARFARDWRTVTGRRESRREKMSPQSMVGALVRVVVRTTTKDDKQRPLSLPNQYSVVDYIEDVIAGGHSAR